MNTKKDVENYLKKKSKELVAISDIIEGHLSDLEKIKSRYSGKDGLKEDDDYIRKMKDFVNAREIQSDIEKSILLGRISLSLEKMLDLCC